MSGVLRILRSAGIVTVQDLGWRTGRAAGLPAGGAMDQAALKLGNALVGNPDGAAGLEMALGGVTIEADRDVRVALTGHPGRATLGDAVLRAGEVHVVTPGQRLVVEPPAGGRFGYLALAGGIAVPETLGSRATYLPTGLGGFGGRKLAAGDELPLGIATSREPSPDGATALPPADPERRIRITAGPQSHLFPDESFERLVAEPYRVTPASDRMGTRLDGPVLSIRTTATLPSEATCLGALQVPDGGQPIAVLRDGPTVGGYPKIGVVIRADLDRFCQVPLGDRVRFEWVSVATAQVAWRKATTDLEAALSAIRRR